jgi:hypothetical protein
MTEPCGIDVLVGFKYGAQADFYKEHASDQNADGSI